MLFKAVPTVNLIHRSKRFFCDSSAQIMLTENAKNKMKEFQNKYLRIAVDVGGCHGLQYSLELVDTYEKDDVVLDRVVMDAVSLNLLKGSTLDYTTELIGSSFQIINNPNSDSSCGCNASFSLK